MSTNGSDVKINIKTDTNEAVRKLRQLEKQADKIGNIADQGEQQQKGFLSKRQVELYKRILKEMEQAHVQHTNRLAATEEKLKKSQENEMLLRAKRLEDEVKKRTELLRVAEGGNRWGEQAHPVVQEFHRQKLDTASEELKNLTESPDYANLIRSNDSLETEIEKLREVLEQMGSEFQRGQGHSERAGELRVRDQYTDQVDGVTNFAKHLMPLGPIGLAHYTGQGMNKLRQQEESAWQVSQKMDSFTGIKQHDEYLRTAIKDTGVSNGYDVGASATTMGMLIQGGTNGDLGARTQDLDSIQKLARSSAMDVDSIAIASADLEKIGALNEGSMKRFAELIAGSIEKSGMQGREEELLRSVSSLASTVSSGLSGLDDVRLGELMGIQNQVAEAIPTLSGDKGAEVLSGMDSAIKNGDNAFDLIMGKGVLPEFSGIKGVYNLELMKEQGLTSSTLQYMFKGLDRTYGEGNHELKSLTAQSKFGLSAETYNKMVESGLADQFKSGNAVGEDEIRALGDAALTRDYTGYEDTSSAEVQSMNAWSENRQADFSQPVDEAHKGVMGAFNSMPRWAQNSALIAGGALGLPLLYKGGKYLASKVSPRANGTGGIANGMRNLTGSLGGAGSSLVDGAKNLGSTISSKASDIWGSIKGAGSRLIGGGGDDVARAVPLADNVASAGLKVGAKIPVAGALIGTVGDQLINEENSWGRSLAKGVGGALGGALGFAGGTALGLGTGGAGFLGLGATTIGGGVAGEKVADSIYSFFAGDPTKSKTVSKTLPTQENGATAPIVTPDITSSSSVQATLAKDTSSSKKLDLNKDLSNIEPEHHIKITIDGSIQGMTKDNQDEITIGVRKYFEKVVKNRNTGLNLSFDQFRT